MAVVKLGVVVTAIAGTVDGATFRRFKGSTILQKRNNGASRNKLAQNKALSRMGSFVKGWSFLNPAIQTEWNDAAQLFQFPDKFGDMRNLSGRSMYLKLQGNMLVVDSPIIDAPTMSSVIVPATIQSSIFAANGQKSLTLNNPANGAFMLVQVQPNLEGQRALVRNRSQILGWTLPSDSTVLDFTTLFNEQYPYAKAGDKFLVKTQSMNAWGFRQNGPTLFLELSGGVSTYTLTFDEGLKEYMSTSDYLLLGAWSISMSISWDMSAGHLYLLSGPNSLIYVSSLGSVRYKGNDGVTHSSVNGQLAVTGTGVLLMTHDGVNFKFYLDGVLKFDIPAHDEFTISHIFRWALLYSNVILTALVIEIFNYPFTAGSGNKLGAATGLPLTLHSNGNVNDMWSI